MSVILIRNIFTLFILQIILPGFLKADSVYVDFRYCGNAKEVSVAGSFNGWNAASAKMKLTDSCHTLRLLLPEGFHYYKFIADGKWIPDPENTERINDGGDSFNSVLKAGNPPVPQRKRSQIPFPAKSVPEPVYDDDPLLINLYYAALEMAWNKITYGTTENGFALSFMDEGFNEYIYQWDDCFIARFGIYAPGVFPAMNSIDNFYSRQRPDGYIQRVYSEETGLPAAVESSDEPMINPPLFSWIEFEYYRITGDTSRIRRTASSIEKYMSWLENNIKDPAGSGLYYNTHLGSGMDNVPRADKGIWIDQSLQMAMAYDFLSRLYGVIHDTLKTNRYFTFSEQIREKILKICYNHETAFLHDVSPEGIFNPVKHVGAFWAFSAGINDPSVIGNLIKTLCDSTEFMRYHPFPAISARSAVYNPRGHYWRGGVWTPVNFMIIKGLERIGEQSFADYAALLHLNRIKDIYFNFKPDSGKIEYSERYEDGYNTIWECYSPDFPEPATRWDDTFYSRQDFAGWTALAPVALFIENIIGLRIEGYKNRVIWNLRGGADSGLKNFSLPGQKVSIIRRFNEGKPYVEVTAEKQFELIIVTNGISVNYTVQPGYSRLEPED